MHQTLATCSALALVAMASTPASACPPNGCGTDAWIAARTRLYNPPAIYAPSYAGPVYGYMASPAKAKSARYYANRRARQAK